MEHQTRTHPVLSACGLNCGLCLQKLLANYNDGRKKSFFCVAVNLLKLDDLKGTIRQIENEVNPDASIKEKAKTATLLFQALANERNISLKLRKK